MNTTSRPESTENFSSDEFLRDADGMGGVRQSQGEKSLLASDELWGVHVEAIW